MKLFFLPLFALTLFRAAGCGEGDCGPAIRVRNPLPRFASDNYQVVAASVDGFCLTVTLSATGCSSKGWELALWAEGEPGNEPSGILVFDDGVGQGEMTCQAIIEETYRFDLEPYLGDAARPASFGLSGTEVRVEMGK